VPRRRMQRSKRSDNVDRIVKMVLKIFGRSTWTVPDLKSNRVKVRNGVINHMHCSGFIKKEGTRRVYYPKSGDKGAICAVWKITSKGVKRAGA
jgi:hypothetical protein